MDLLSPCPLTSLSNTDRSSLATLDILDTRTLLDQLLLMFTIITIMEVLEEQDQCQDLWEEVDFWAVEEVEFTLDLARTVQTEVEPAEFTLDLVRCHHHLCMNKNNLILRSKILDLMDSLDHNSLDNNNLANNTEHHLNCIRRSFPSTRSKSHLQVRLSTLGIV